MQRWLWRRDMPSKAKACPVCGKPFRTEFAPFCSPACRDRDLLKWLGEGYRIPGQHLDPDTIDDSARRIEDSD